MKHSLWKATPAGINGVTENVLSLITMSRKVAAALFILTCFDSIVICKYIPKTKKRTKSEPSLNINISDGLNQSKFFIC